MQIIDDLDDLFKIELDNVCYVPEFKINLISIAIGTKGASIKLEQKLYRRVRLESQPQKENASNKLNATNRVMNSQYKNMEV